MEAMWAQSICLSLVAGVQWEASTLESRISGLSSPSLDSTEKIYMPDLQGAMKSEDNSAGLYLHLQ